MKFDKTIQKVTEAILNTWKDAGTNSMPTYQEYRDIRNERTGYKLDKIAYKGTIDSLKDELSKLKKELNNLEEQLYLWEEVPSEDLWEDGELKLGEVFDKINYHLFVEGDWKLMRRKDNE
tara:strand:- start:791 stop:1150 length:360 start_codon:yes stop_codon:yes gene_type:complete